MIRTLRILCGLGLSAAVATAAANGGPVEWTGGTAVGGVHPSQESDIRLVREKLRIFLLEDMNHKAVEIVPFAGLAYRGSEYQILRWN